MIDRGELARKLVLNAARLSGLAPLAGRYFAGVGAILMLHKITATPPNPLGVNRHLTITPAFLDTILTEMKRLGYRFVSLDEAVDRLRTGSAERFATITADDAYRDNLLEALPVLEKHEAPFAIYVAPALIEGSIVLWWDVLEEIVRARDIVYLPTPRGTLAYEARTTAQKVAANTEIHNYLTTELPEENQFALIRDLAVACDVDWQAPRRNTLMSWNEVRRTAAHPLVTIGAHTVHHYNLKRLCEEKARREISEAAGILEVELGARPAHMSFPYGYASAVGPREIQMARDAGFVTAVTTRHGLLQPEHVDHLHALPRISVNGRYQRLSHVSTMLSGLTTPLANRGRRVVTV